MSESNSALLSLNALKNQRRFKTALVNLLGVFAFQIIMSSPASAQLKKRADATLEQEVDKAFGVVVGAMASVLFWDVTVWDNDAPLTAQSELKGEAVLSDPIGWGLFTQQAGGVKLFDFQGQERGLYRGDRGQAEAQIQAVWLINKGSELLVRSAEGSAFIYRRAVAGQEVLAPTPVPPLPQGEWTMFTELGDELLFGSSAGHIYQLNRSGGELKWTDKPWKLTGPVQLITARDDGRYWVAFDRVGAGVIIERSKENSSGELRETQVAELTLPSSLGGAPKSAGFHHDQEHDQIWVTTDVGMIAWSAEDLKVQLQVTLKDINSVNTIALSDSAQGYLLTSASAPARLFDLSGASQDLQASLKAKSENDSHPLSVPAQSVTPAGDHLWVINPAGAHQVALSLADHFKVESLLKLEGGQELTLSGGRVITRDQKGIKVWRSDNLQLPLIVLWLVCGALFFTVRMRFVNLRLFRHAIDVVRGRYTDPNSAGEVSHFQALTSALSATVGLGNIAGVAIAVGVGGPGATFWMIVAGFLGMASKFTECTLGQKYRTFSASGEVMGGAMHYLSDGLAQERGLSKLGKTLAILFSILCVGASFGGGNAFQVKQSFAAVAEVVPVLKEMSWLYGVIMAVAVGVVILGGIKSIAQTAEKIVPLMCGVYLLAAAYIIVVNISLVPEAFGLIFQGAFSPDALYGGAIGVLVVGFKRAAFSNEAGIGSAAIAHAAAKTEYPIREGAVALLEPFIDTIVVCTMTALVIVITGAYQNPEYGALITSNNGAALTSQAMGSVISFFPYILSVAVILFAYSTMISWSYYGERCWSWLFGEEGALFSMGRSASLIYKLTFLVFAFLGSIVTATNILDFSDLMILGMALPNIYGLFLLSRGVKRDLIAYEEKLNAGAFPIYHAGEEIKGSDEES